ncbi:MAG: SDR family NAD(P)-dependent oxidoreductase [Candidatus Korobacteraceae bacterium]
MQTVGRKTQSRKIVVLGATSKIAQEIARLAAADHKELLLVARHPERLAAVTGDLAARGASRVESIAADLAAIDSHPALVSEILAKMPDFDTLLLAYGSLGDQARAEDSPEITLTELNTNFTSAVSLLTRLSPVLAARGVTEQPRACIAVITSVAGDRGRRSNYIYGTAKGALALFAQGLRAKLYSAGIRVLTIKPGPVATPMTAHMPGSAKFADPAAVARAIYREIEQGRRDILYVPGKWRWIMTVIRLIPESIGKQLKF